MAVAGGLPRVRRVLPRLPDTPGGHHEGLGREDDELTTRAPVAHGGADPTVGVFQQPEDLALHEDLDTDGHGPLLQRPDQLEAGPVTHVGQPGEAVASEVTLEDPAVLRPVEQGAPPFQLVDPVGGLLGVELGHPPVVEHLPAPHGVAEVDLPVVLGPDVAHGRRRPALGHDGVGLAQERLAHEGGPQAPLLGLDGGPHTGATGADDDDVEIVGFVISHGRAQKIFGSWKAPLATSRT